MTARMALTEIAQEAWKAYLRPDSQAIDATAGNGQDTLFLARHVGEQGKVYAVDIQGSALKATSAILESAGLMDKVTLIQGDHANLKGLMERCSFSRLDLICFNLGYLPGGDHGIVTSSQSSCTALEASLNLLAPGGILSVIAYRGHPGGMEEAESIETFLKDLPREWICRHHLETGSEKRPGPVWWLYQNLNQIHSEPHSD